jgi:hypothetical protein
MGLFSIFLLNLQMEWIFQPMESVTATQKKEAVEPKGERDQAAGTLSAAARSRLRRVVSGLLSSITTSGARATRLRPSALAR